MFGKQFGLQKKILARTELQYDDITRS